MAFTKFSPDLILLICHFCVIFALGIKALLFSFPADYFSACSLLLLDRILIESPYGPSQGESNRGFQCAKKNGCTNLLYPVTSLKSRLQAPLVCISPAPTRFSRTFFLSIVELCNRLAPPESGILFRLWGHKRVWISFI